MYSTVRDREGRFTFTNAEISHLSGHAPSEIISHHYSEILHPKDTETAGRAFHKRRTGERVARRVEVLLWSRGGKTLVSQLKARVELARTTGTTLRIIRL